MLGHLLTFGYGDPPGPDAPVPVYTEDELKRLLNTTTGKGFEQRRERNRHNQSKHDALWIGPKGGLTESGIA